MGRPPLDWIETFNDAGTFTNAPDQALISLYILDKLSLRKIAAKLKVDPYTIKRKLVGLGIILRGRGGKNNTKLLFITDKELRTVPAKKLAQQYNVSLKTIYNRRSML